MIYFAANTVSVEQRQLSMVHITLLGLLLILFSVCDLSQGARERGLTESTDVPYVVIKMPLTFNKY